MAPPSIDLRLLDAPMRDQRRHGSQSHDSA
jgi:hypothetical protein